MDNQLNELEQGILELNRDILEAKRLVRKFEQRDQTPSKIQADFLEKLAIINMRLSTLDDKLSAEENRRAGRGKFSNKFLEWMGGAEIDHPENDPPEHRVVVTKTGEVFKL